MGEGVDEGRGEGVGRGAAETGNEEGVVFEGLAVVVEDVKRCEGAGA